MVIQNYLVVGTIIQNSRKKESSTEKLVDFLEFLAKNRTAVWKNHFPSYQILREINFCHFRVSKMAD